MRQQILFVNATPERSALSFAVLGAPTLKMVRHQERFGFFAITTGVPSLTADRPAVA